ncbi:unnamed protein product [Heterosigma akashiwo]
MRFTGENLLYLATGAAAYAAIQYLTNKRKKNVPNSVGALGSEITDLLPSSPNVEEDIDGDDGVVDTNRNVNRPTLAPVIEKELFSRNVGFFGEEGQAKIRGAYVVVVGLGGVGSHCAHMLARSGVGRMRIIDFDQVTLSSLNRHATASFSDVGQSKVDVLKDCLAGMAPACEVIAINQMFKGTDAEKLLLPKGTRTPDYIIDCIDDTNTKLELLLFCVRRGLRVIASLSAGGKCDPTRLHLGTLADAVKDPLAAKMRWRMKKENVNPDDIPVLYSSELQRAWSCCPHRRAARWAAEDSGRGQLRVRIIPVVGTMPALFGQTLAAQVLCQLAGQPFAPQPGPRLATKLVHKVWQTLKTREIKLRGNAPEPWVDNGAIEYMIVQVWRQRCAVTGNRFGGPTRLPVLARWDAARPLAPDNLVLLMPDLADKLEKEGQGVFDESIRQKITNTLADVGEDDWV